MGALSGEAEHLILTNPFYGLEEAYGENIHKTHLKISSHKKLPNIVSWHVFLGMFTTTALSKIAVSALCFPEATIPAQHSEANQPESAIILDSIKL